MKHNCLAACLASWAFVCAGPAASQDGSWDYTATLYLWAAETETSAVTARGQIDATLSFSDALDNLDFAFMGTLEARKGKWSLIGDFMQTDISFENDTPGPAFSGVDAEVRTQVFNAYSLHQVRADASWSFDIGVGVRWFNTETTLTLNPGIAAGRSAGIDDDWFDPLAAARVQFDIADRWSATAFVDYGGFRSNSTSWQAVLGAQYEISERWNLIAAYRYLDVKHGPDSSEYKFSQSGPLLGVSFEF